MDFAHESFVTEKPPIRFVRVSYSRSQKERIQKQKYMCKFRRKRNFLAAPPKDLQQISGDGFSGSKIAFAEIIQWRLK
jgi:hypothetical protein